MDSLFLKNRRLLLLCIFASLGGLSLSRFDQADPTIEETTATDSCEGLIEAAPSPFLGVAHETTEVYVDEVDVEIVHGRAGRQEPEPPPHYRNLDARKEPVLGPTPPPYAVPAQTRQHGTPIFLLPVSVRRKFEDHERVPHRVPRVHWTPIFRATNFRSNTILDNFEAFEDAGIRRTFLRTRATLPVQT